MAEALASIAVPTAGKCAASMAAKNCLRRKYCKSVLSGSVWIFCTKCNFLQVLDLLIFRQIFEMQPCLHSKKGPHSWGRP